MPDRIISEHKNFNLNINQERITEMTMNPKYQMGIVHMKMRIVLMVLAFMLMKMDSVVAEETAAIPPATETQAGSDPVDQAMNRHLLSEYGPYKTIAEAKETLLKAIGIVPF